MNVKTNYVFNPTAVRTLRSNSLLSRGGGLTRALGLADELRKR